MPHKDSYNKVMSILLAYGKVRRKNAELQHQVESLVMENQHLQQEIQRCKVQLETLREKQEKLDATHQKTPERNNVLHSRHLLKLRQKKLQKTVSQLDEQLEKLQLATFPVFP